LVTKAVYLFLLTGLIPAAASAAQDQAAPAPKTISESLHNLAPESCKNNDSTEVVVCGRSQQRYRIDPTVLAATRAAEAPPPKPKLDATTATACTGPNCGGGDYVPLVGMALTALKAAELAAEGEDWRDAFRTHPDAYREYQDAKRRTSRISIGVTAGNK
jgi:hypothetical protein